MILRCSLVLVVIRVFDTFPFSLTYKFHVVHGRYEGSLMHEDLQRLFAGEMKDMVSTQSKRKTHIMYGDTCLTLCTLMACSQTENATHHHGMSFSHAEKKKKIMAAIKCWNGCLQSKKCRAANCLLAKRVVQPNKVWENYLFLITNAIGVQSLNRLSDERMPIIQCLLKGWGCKITSHYLYIWEVITTTCDDGNYQHK